MCGSRVVAAAKKRGVSGNVFLLTTPTHTPTHVRFSVKVQCEGNTPQVQQDVVVQVQ